MRDSMDRKSLTGTFNFTAGTGTGAAAGPSNNSKVQFSTASVSTSQEMRPKVTDSLASMTVPKTDEASKLLQSDRAK